MTVSDTEVRVRFPNAKDAVSVPLDRVNCIARFQFFDL